MYRMKAPLASAGPAGAHPVGLATGRDKKSPQVLGGGYGAAGVATPADGPVVGGEFASRLSRQG